jgi:tRNA pseudouridine13 synthase
MNDPVSHMLYLTADLPGTGGRIKVEPEDFVVTEIPLYLPSGEGDHVYIYIKKEGIGSLEAAGRIATALGRPRHLVGLAGLKDARAITRQWLSVERVDPAKVEALRLPNIKILKVARHRNRLKIGHLAGNRFEIRIRRCQRNAKATAMRVLEVLQERGVPNWFDRQRFGVRGDNHVLGRAIVLGQAQEFCDRFLGHASRQFDLPRMAHARRMYDKGDLVAARRGFVDLPDQLRVLTALQRTQNYEHAMNALPKQLMRLLVSAIQSDLFNAVLERRIESLDRVEAGDLAYIHPQGGHGGGAVFTVERPEEEAPRAARFEISPTGPIVGHRVTMASGEPGEIEREVLAEKEMKPEDFESVKALRLRGGRRPLRVPLIDPKVQADGRDLLIQFELPSGAYATIVLGEIMKAEDVEEE